MNLCHSIFFRPSFSRLSAARVTRKLHVPGLFLFIMSKSGFLNGLSYLSYEIPRFNVIGIIPQWYEWEAMLQYGHADAPVG